MSQPSETGPPVGPGAQRVPPHNISAEESLLGAMMLSPQAVSEVAGKVSSDDFYKPAHRHIFDAIQALSGDGTGVDSVTLSEELDRLGLLEGVGGSAHLMSLQSHTPAITNAAYYAEIVAEKSLLRRLIAAARDVGELGYAPLDDIDKTIDQAESTIFAVAQRRENDTTRPINELVGMGLDTLADMEDRGDDITGNATGYADLDRLLAGLQPSSLSIVGARPGMGKTAFALTMASHMAVHERKPVLFFSLEMSRLELTYRLLSSEARVDSKKFRSASLNSKDWTKLNQAASDLAGARLWIDDNPAVTLTEIRGKARRLQDKEQEPLGMVVVDYLQLMEGRGNAESRQVEVSQISRGLKILARELDAPVVALSQLSRQLESRSSDRRPQLSDLRESGCMTADTRLRRADNNAEITFGELLAEGITDIPVWSLDGSWRMVPSVLTNVFESGTKEVFRLRLASGREVTASANHPFRTVLGWKRLDELTCGSRLAVPRILHAPESLLEVPEQTIGDWVESVCSGTGIPSAAHALNDSQLARFLSLLFGRIAYLSVTELRGKPHVRLAASCSRREVLTEIQELLLRFGIHGRISSTGANRRLHRLWIHGVDQQKRFLTEIGVDGPKAKRLDDALVALGSQRSNPNVDTIPCEVRELVVAELARADLTQRDLAALLGEQYCGGYLLGTDSRPRCSSRGRLERIAEVLESKELDELANSEVMWDEVVEITSLGEQPTYDATVAGTHNFVANGVIAHNSIEQDADVVMFLYRESVYSKELNDDTTEVIVAKHRAGPRGTVQLMFQGYCTRFDNLDNFHE